MGDAIRPRGFVVENYVVARDLDLYGLGPSFVEREEGLPKPIELPSKASGFGACGAWNCVLPSHIHNVQEVEELVLFALEFHSRPTQVHSRPVFSRNRCHRKAPVRTSFVPEC